MADYQSMSDSDLNRSIDSHYAEIRRIEKKKHPSSEESLRRSQLHKEISQANNERLNRHHVRGQLGQPDPLVKQERKRAKAYYKLQRKHGKQNYGNEPPSLL